MVYWEKGKVFFQELKTAKSHESIYLKIIPVTVDVVENCLYGSGTWIRKKTVKKLFQLSMGKGMVTWMWVVTILRGKY